MRLAAKVAAIQLEGDSVRVTVVKTGGAKPAVLEQHEARAEYTDIEHRHDALVTAIRDAVGRIGTPPAGFVLCVSSLYTISRLMQLPLRGRHRIAKVVRFELEPYLAFPVDEVVVDFSMANELDGSSEVLAVGIRKSTLTPMLDVLEEAGVKIDGIMPDISGLSALWAIASKRGNGPTAVLHVRHDRCVLTVVYRRALAYTRQITRGIADIEQDPAAVAREAQNSMRAFQAQWTGEETIDALVVTGCDPTPEQRAAFDETAMVPVLFEELNGAYTVPGGAAAPPSIIPAGGDEDAANEGAAEGDDGGGRRPPDFGDWADLTGVAVASAGTEFAFEFRRDDLAARHTLEGVARHLAFSGLIAAMVLVGYFVYSFVQYQQNRTQIAAIGDQIWELYARAKPDSEYAMGGRPADDFGGAETFRRINMSEEFGMLMDAMGADGDFSFGELSPAMFNQPTILEHLAEISLSMPGDEVKITDIRISATRGATAPRLIIEGEVVTMAALDRAYARLRESAETFTVEGSPVTRMGQDGVTRFTISAQL